ncbi:MAG: ribonuclease P protein component [Bacteroidales bacterium]
MGNTGYTFSKAERLSSRKAITELFEDGNSFFYHPFTVVWRAAGGDNEFPARVGISVPKKTFKRAVDRNRIKRITREAWRHNKQTLYNFLNLHNKEVVIMLIYTGRELPSLKEMNERIEKLVAKFSLILLQQANSGSAEKIS